jgi:putative peptide zinc metalloprotease protein
MFFDAAGLEAAGTLPPHRAPELADDVQITLFNSNGDSPRHVVKSLSRGTYVSTNAVGVAILKGLDGRRTVADLQHLLDGRKVKLPAEKIEMFLDMCERSGVLKAGTWGPAEGGAVAPTRRRGVRFHRRLVSGEWALDFLVRHRRVWLNPLTTTLWLALLLVGAAYALWPGGGAHVAAPLYAYRADSANFILAFIFPLFLLEVGVHELAHGLACRLLGVRPGGFGFGMLWGVLPIFYTDTSESYTIDSKYQRALISAAGPMVDLGCLGIAALVVWLAPDASALQRFAQAYAALPLSSLLINLNPFILRMDGYWIVSDLLEQPNLRTMTRRYVADLFGRVLGRAPSLGLDAPCRGGLRGAVYLGYGVVSVVWTAAFVVGFVYSLAKGFAHLAAMVAR